MDRSRLVSLGRNFQRLPEGCVQGHRNIVSVAAAPMTMEEFAEMNDELANMRARLKAARQREQAANAALAELELEMEDERLEMEAEMASLTRRAATLGHDPERR